MAESIDSSSPGAVVVVLPGEGRNVRLGNAGMVTIKGERAHSGGRMTAYEFEMPPQTAGPPLHIHQSWDEAFYVIGGELTFLINGAEHLAPAGSFIFIPHAVPHTFWNAGLIPARQLVVFTPSGIEDYFDAVGAVLDGGADESLSGAIALMEQHDMIVPQTDRPAYGAI